MTAYTLLELGRDMCVYVCVADSDVKLAVDPTLDDVKLPQIQDSIVCPSELLNPKTQSHRYSAIPDYHQLTDKVEIRIMKSPRFDAGFVTSATVASMYGLTQHILNFIAFTHVWVSSPESDKESRESLFFICASFSVQLRLWKLQRTLTSSDTSQHRINVAKNQVVRQRDPEWAETNRMIESLRLSHLAMSSILSICHGGTYLVFLLGNSTKSTLGSPLAKIKWWQSWFIFQQFFASKGSAR